MWLPVNNRMPKAQRLAEIHPDPRSEAAIADAYFAWRQGLDAMLEP